MDADIGAHRQFDAVEHKVDLTKFGRDAGRGRRQNDVDRLEQLQHLRAVPAAEFLRAIDHRRRDHRARDQAIAHGGIEILRPRAQPVEVKRRAFARRDHISGGAGAGGFAEFRPMRLTPSALATRPPPRRLRERRSSGNSRRPWRCADRRCLAPARRDRLGGPRRAGGISGIRSLHRVIGERKIGRRLRASGPT